MRCARRRLVAAPLVLCAALQGCGQGGTSEPATRPDTTTTQRVIDSYPSPSPVTRTVVFQSNRTGRWEIFSMNSDGMGARQLTSGTGDKDMPRVSPDGSLIAYRVTIDDNPEIYVMNADGSAPRRLTNSPGDDSHPHWTRDGSRIVFNSARTTADLRVDWFDQSHEVFTMKADGTDLRQITHCRTVCSYPSLSPDGTRLVYRKVIDGSGLDWAFNRMTRNSEVFVANADGSNERNLSVSDGFDGWPEWSPDGRFIAFASNRAGPARVGQIYLIDPNGGQPRQITVGPWSHVQPAWSSDGRTLYVYRLDEVSGPEFGSIAAIAVSP